MTLYEKNCNVKELDFALVPVTSRPTAALSPMSSRASLEKVLVVDIILKTDSFRLLD